MMFCERRIIPTSLEPIPRSLRASLGYIAMSPKEIAALKRNQPADYDILAEVVKICQVEDSADAFAFRTFKFKPRKVTANTAKLAPSHRMAMLNAVYRKS